MKLGTPQCNMQIYCIRYHVFLNLKKLLSFLISTVNKWPIREKPSFSKWLTTSTEKSDIFTEHLVYWYNRVLVYIVLVHIRIYEDLHNKCNKWSLWFFHISPNKEKEYNLVSLKEFEFIFSSCHSMNVTW